MKVSEQEIYQLNNFEGPLDFLLYLVQKNEIDIYDIPLHTITDQYLKKLKEWLEPSIESGADFIGIASLLLYLKTKMLLPQHDQVGLEDQEGIDPRFEIIHQLLEYCRFKEAAKELAEREMNQSAFYFRGTDDSYEPKKPLGIEHLGLEDLAILFKQVLSKAQIQSGLIHEETWRVSDKIRAIRQYLIQHNQVEFLTLFTSEKSRDELIVTFLAVLELMKLGEISVIKDLKLQKVMINKK